MIIGVPKEIKNNENRVAAVPAGVRDLVASGHQVLVQAGAGEGIDILDEQYRNVGAEVVATAEEVWKRAEMIVKVKEPMPSEWPHVRADHVLFTYFHFASSRDLTEAMLKSGATCIAYETVEDRKKTHPLLTPMSEVAGRLSIQAGSTYLEKVYGGRGVLLGGVPGVEPARVMVIGGGVVGTNAAKMAAGLGAIVVIMDVNLDRLRYLDDVMPANVITMYASTHNIEDQLRRSDVVVGGVYLAGAKAPHVITRAHLDIIPRGTVLVDVAIDQGGCFESSKPTTHSEPVYVENGIIHYCVTNMPGAVARTSTFALTNATFPYLARLANKGWKDALKADEGFLKGLNVSAGKIVYSAVGEAFGMPSQAPETVLN
ncbi:MAG: alanine dehydrogenase [Candidatus Sumerlaeota bacterium]|nr:alanine dehydrogenase [Candidatus Sumerlaeota bacterium]